MASANAVAPVRCWICGATADSSEHSLKKADIERGYGKGSYRGPSAPLHVKGGQITGLPLQGPNSRRIKYRELLCQHCNTTRTQPFDYAYDRFIRCRLVDAGQTVPEELVNFLLRDEDRANLKNTLTISEDILAFPPHVRRGYVSKGVLEGRGAENSPTSYHSYLWDEQVSWLMIYHWYNLQPEAVRDPESTIAGRYIRLDSVKVWSSEEHAEIQAKFGARTVAEMCDQPLVGGGTGDWEA